MTAVGAIRSKKLIRRPIAKYLDANGNPLWVQADTILYRQVLATVIPANYAEAPPYWWLTEEDFFAYDWEIKQETEGND
jgi:hypothetical protein